MSPLIGPLFELRGPEKVNLAGLPTDRDHLSHSALGTFLACEQKFSWSYEHRLTPAVTAEPLQLGRAFAHALEHNDPSGGATFLRQEAEREAERAAGSPWISAPDSQDVDKNAMIVEHASRAYLDRYGSRDQTREVELRARIRNPAVGGRYSLTHDLLARIDALDVEGKVLYEDKLAGQIPKRSLASRLKLDRQVTIGCYLAWRCLGVEVGEVRYRITRKPAIRQRQNESFDGYLERIAEEYATKPDEYLHEEPLTRTPEDFLRLEQELWRWSEQIRSARHDGVWPRNVAHCADYNGCPFLSACAREPGWQHQFRKREPSKSLSDESNQTEAA